MTDVNVLTIAGVSAAPGTKERGFVEVAELADGTKVRLPLLLVNGARAGPRLYLGAAIHGDEVDGIAILSEALAKVDPAGLAGQIVCVPVQHPLALYADHRLPLAQFLKSPLDQAPADAWTIFPGDLKGNLAQQIAAHLFGMIKQCDYALDIHTPTRGGRYVPIAILPHPALPLYDKVLAFAEGVEPGWIMKGDKGFYVADGILSVEATRAGVPCFTFEIGEGGRLEPEVVRTGANCVSNALQFLGMTNPKRSSAPKTYRMRDFLGIRATRGGLLYNDVTLGSEVEKGQVLARIVNVYGDEVERAVAPEDGVLVRTTTLSTVSTGDRVATLGLLEDAV
jgi:predicted deacylase